MVALEDRYLVVCPSSGGPSASADLLRSHICRGKVCLAVARLWAAIDVDAGFLFQCYLYSFLHGVIFLFRFRFLFENLSDR